jgi:hypothetical protein
VTVQPASANLDLVSAKVAVDWSRRRVLAWGGRRSNGTSVFVNNDGSYQCARVFPHCQLGHGSRQLSMDSRWIGLVYTDGLSTTVWTMPQATGTGDGSAARARASTVSLCVTVVGHAAALAAVAWAWWQTQRLQRSDGSHGGVQQDSAGRSLRRTAPGLEFAVADVLQRIRRSADSGEVGSPNAAPGGGAGTPSVGRPPAAHATLAAFLGAGGGLPWPWWATYASCAVLAGGQVATGCVTALSVSCAAVAVLALLVAVRSATAHWWGGTTRVQHRQAGAVTLVPSVACAGGYLFTCGASGEAASFAAGLIALVCGGCVLLHACTFWSLLVHGVLGKAHALGWQLRGRAHAEASARLLAEAEASGGGSHMLGDGGRLVAAIDLDAHGNGSAGGGGGVMIDGRVVMGGSQWLGAAEGYGVAGGATSTGGLGGVGLTRSADPDAGAAGPDLVPADAAMAMLWERAPTAQWRTGSATSDAGDGGGGGGGAAPPSVRLPQPRGAWLQAQAGASALDASNTEGVDVVVGEGAGAVVRPAGRPTRRLQRFA